MSTARAIPETWVLTTVGSVCSKPQYGYTTKAADTGELQLLRTSDITTGRISWDTVPFCSENPVDWEKYIVKDGDILVSRAGSVGVSYLVKRPLKAVFASYLIRFKPFIDTQFLAYFLQSPDYWAAIADEKLGIAVPNVNATKLQSIPLPVPPAAEQHRIVAKIEELFSELDKGIENLEKAREQLKVYRQAVLNHAFEGKLTAEWRETRSAKVWVDTTLGRQISHLTSGSRGWAKFYAKQGEKFIRAQNLREDRLDLAEIAFVDLPNESEGLRTRVQLGDLLITITGANVTRTAFVASDIGTAYVNQHVALARPIEGSNTEFLYWFLVSEAAGRKQLKASAYGAGKPGLNLQNIRSVKITLPSVEEQNEIVNRINAILSIERSVSSEIKVQLAKSNALRQSILRKAFSGQLVAQDPKDEPSSALLERIKAEKVAQSQNAKRRNKRQRAKAAA